MIGLTGTKTKTKTKTKTNTTKKQTKKTPLQLFVIGLEFHQFIERILIGFPNFLNK